MGKKVHVKRQKCLKVYLSTEEFSAILASADRAGLSLSTFARKVCLGMQVKSREDQQARRELLKINADLGRLGGLLKQTLAHGAAGRTEVYGILREIDARQRELKEHVRAM